MRSTRSRAGRRVAGALATLVLVACAAACGGDDGPKADAGERNAAAFKKDMFVVVHNDRQQPLAVVGVATSRNVGERLVSQYGQIQYETNSDDTVEFTVRLATGDLRVVGENPLFGDPTITINGDAASMPVDSRWVFSKADPRIVVERRQDTSGMQNFDFWVGW